jgi:hypothetical protein
MLYTCHRVGHIWPIRTAGFLTYRKVHSHVLSQLLTYNHAAFFGTVANPRAQDPTMGHQLMDCACRRRCGYYDARRHMTGRNVGNDQVVPKLRPGWTLYGVLRIMYLLLLPLEAELWISRVLLSFMCQQACISYLRKKLSSIRHY